MVNLRKLRESLLHEAKRKNYMLKVKLKEIIEFKQSNSTKDEVLKKMRYFFKHPRGICADQ